ncbi:MAG: 1-deoxy-D-xylulose-5-phosphate synthase [Eubacterium sp.]|nr:1-deoxy-D-xylulose-5-phosphate synthase [Eubacterium sp.]
MKKILDEICEANDIHHIDPSDYRILAREIRRRLVRTVSSTGGHLSASLGVVELTIALHLVLTFPEDKLVWDVGHQSYVHKILTGRDEEMFTLRQLGGLSGFPDVRESDADAFSVGHSSTSISAALGLAKARDLRGTEEKVFAVIGDGALSGGMAYEAMNNAVEAKTGLVIVLNDNTMSIAPNVGGMSNYLGQIRSDRRYRNLKLRVEEALDRVPTVGIPLADKIRKTKDSLKHLLLPGMLFEDMGLTYIGPIDGHDIEAMKEAFEAASSMNDETVLVHVITKKGKGYKPAEEKPDLFHGIGAFDIRTGEPLDSGEDSPITYTDVFSAWLEDRGEIHDDLVSVCAAMPDGTGVTAFAEKYPDRAFDVGIAEEHAVTFAAGMAAGGLRPVVSIYSTFLQRAYDQMLHDVCNASYPVIFAVDRSGIVGHDGRTHQGVFDLSYLIPMPGMTVISPMDGEELVSALDYAYECETGPVAIRYPRGTAYRYSPDEDEFLSTDRADFLRGKAEVLSEGREAVIFAVGDMVKTALAVRDELEAEMVRVTVVNMRFVKPFDEEIVRELAGKHTVVATLEDNVLTGGFGESVGAFLQREGIQVKGFLNLALPDEFIPHGSAEELYGVYGLDAKNVADTIREMYHRVR